MKIKLLLGRYWLVKAIVLPFFLIFCILYLPYLYFFYDINLKKVKSDAQLFFQARQEYGAILELLFYINCWTNTRSDVVLVVFNPQFDIVKKLANYICPNLKIICPPVVFSNFIQKALGSFIRELISKPLYYNFLAKYPGAIYIYDIGNGFKWPYIKYLDPVYGNYSTEDEFWAGYLKTRANFDHRFDVRLDFLRLTKHAKKLCVDDDERNRLLSVLNIPGRYVLINVNIKDYFSENQNIRRIVHFDRYNVLIDYLIKIGFSVVLQGKAEQPFFKEREGFVDYAHSKFQSPVNDLILFSGCDFYVSSKTGVEMYGVLFDKPTLGLNYTELCAMNSNIRFRFFPKRVRNELGHFLSWRSFLTHPVYFQSGSVLPTTERVEFVEMEEHEIIAALEEFLDLLYKPREQWLNYTKLQDEFKNSLNPGHMDLYHIHGVPCDAYLNID